MKIAVKVLSSVKTYILVVLAAVFFVPLFAWPDEVQVIETKAFLPKDFHPYRNPFTEAPFFFRLNSINLSHDGGVLISGDKEGPESFFIKLKSDGTTMWLRDFHQDWRGLTAEYAFDSSSGGYWGIGYIQTRALTPKEMVVQSGSKEYLEIEESIAYKYLLKMDEQGKQVSMQKISTLFTHNISCGVDVDDGLILVGTQTFQHEVKDKKEQKRFTTTPWIEKVGYDGQQIWEQTITDNNGGAFDINLNSKGSLCDGLVRNSSGFVLGFSVLYRNLEHDGSKTIIDSGEEKRSKLKTVVVKLDNSGQELKRYVSDDVDGVRIIENNAGYILIEHFSPRIPDAILNLGPLMASGFIGLANSTDGGVRVTSLNNQLVKIGTKEFKIPSINSKFKDVLVGANGQYYIVGCDKSEKEHYIALNPSSGSVVDFDATKGQAAFQCGNYKWIGVDSKGILSLLNSTGLNGDTIKKVKFPN
jgi:hypothetical protein